jgi:hypothetical protein
VSPWLASLGCLCACPQILSDDFDPAVTTGAAGAGICSDALCSAGTGGSSIGGAGSGVGGATGGAGASAGVETGGTPGDAGNGGAAAAAGAVGQAGASPEPDGADAAAPDPSDDDASLGPDCWALVLNDTTQDTSGNCIDIQGWNDVVTDPDTPTTVVTRSYTGGAVCFQGTLQPAGWGAVYNLTFANEALWDATSHGIGGFQLSATGAALPPKLEVIYSAPTDFCSLVTPGPDVRIPFSSAHPNCSTTPGSGVPDPTRLEFLRLHIPSSTTVYSINFCLHIRAIR